MDDVRLIHGNCLEVLKTLESGSVDAVVTDPPYCSGGLKANSRIASTGVKYCRAELPVLRPDFCGDQLDQRCWMLWCREWLTECLRLLKPGGYCLAFTDWRQLPGLSDCFQMAGLNWRGVLSWDKTESAHAPTPGYFRRQCEFIVWGTRSAIVNRRKAEGGGLFAGAFRSAVRQADKHHQTGKPVPVMRWLVECCPPGGLVLDPFMGSGTTGVACLQSGRRFLGIELSREYYDVAQRRLAEAQAVA